MSYGGGYGSRGGGGGYSNGYDDYSNRYSGGQSAGRDYSTAYSNGYDYPRFRSCSLSSSHMTFPYLCLPFSWFNIADMLVLVSANLRSTDANEVTAAQTDILEEEVAATAIQMAIPVEAATVPLQTVTPAAEVTAEIASVVLEVTRCPSWEPI